MKNRRTNVQEAIQRMPMTRLFYIRLNNCRSDVEEVLVAEELTAELRRKLLHTERVLGDYVNQLDILATEDEVDAECKKVEDDYDREVKG